MGISIVSVANLKDHPRNRELFDNLQGAKWEEFKRDIASTGGAREPIVITSDNVIISGHQRVRAHKELGLMNIPADTVNYNGDEEAMLHDLIALNVQQRGRIEGTAYQLNERRKIMENWYNIRENAGMTQGEIAVKAGMKPIQASIAKSIMNVVDEHPELKEANQNGFIAESTILNIAHQEKEVQDKVVAALDLQKPITGREVQIVIDETTGKAEDDRQKAEKELQERIEEATAGIVAEHREVIEEKDREIKALKKENARIKISPHRHRQVEKIASNKIRRGKKEHKKMAYELCQEDEFGGTSNSELLDELVFTLKGCAQDFIDVYSSLMTNSDFEKKYLGISANNRNDLKACYQKIKEIVSTLLAYDI